MHTQYTHTHTFRVMLINPGQLDTTCPGFKLGIAWEKVRTRKDAATISATNSWCTALMPSREFNLSLLILSNNCWIPDARTTLRHARWWISIIALVKRLCNCSIGQKVALVKGSAIALVKRLCNCIGQKVVQLQHWSKVVQLQHWSKGCIVQRLCNCIGQKVVQLQHWSKGCAIALVKMLHWSKVVQLHWSKGCAIALVKRLCNCSIGQKVVQLQHWWKGCAIALVKRLHWSKGCAIAALVKRLCNCSIGKKVVQLHWSKGCAIAALVKSCIGQRLCNCSTTKKRCLYN